MWSWIWIWVIGFGISSKTLSYNDAMNKTLSDLLSRPKFKYLSQKKRNTFDGHECLSFSFGDAFLKSGLDVPHCQWAWAWTQAYQYWNWRSFYYLSSTRDWYGNCWYRLLIKKKLHYKNHIPWGPACKRAKGNLHYINQGLLECVAQLGNNLIDISFQNNPKISNLTSVVT